MENKRVVVAMSGGVDSSMTAKRMVDAGYDVLGVYLKLHGNEVSHAANIANIEKVSKYLGIKYEIVPLAESFEKFVVNPFIEYYKSGLTPNPCTFCNREIKFGALVKFATDRGYDYLATGHYVRCDGEFFREAFDKSKDQSYFLFNVKREILPRLIFPLGETIKAELKEEAAKIPEIASLSTQKESSEICFVTENYIETLKELGIETDGTGKVVDESGKEVGIHKGFMHYTVGQRKGFDVPLSHVPLYVKEIDAENNKVVVCEKEGIYAESLEAENLNMFTDETSFECQVKVRYRSEKTPASVEIKDGTAHIRLKNPQFAIAKGQAAVFYDGDKVLGGGYIS
ncbi:MAG: tRNA 2-thiouridine(34) synthase MnmA [Campylobacterales bacterium]